MFAALCLEVFSPPIKEDFTTAPEWGTGVLAITATYQTGKTAYAIGNTISNVSIPKSRYMRFILKEFAIVI